MKQAFLFTTLEQIIGTNTYGEAEYIVIANDFSEAIANMPAKNGMTINSIELLSARVVGVEA